MSNTNWLRPPAERKPRPEPHTPFEAARRGFVNFMRQRGLWFIVAAEVALIALVLASLLPPGERFIYPLRHLFFQIRLPAYWATVILVTLTSAYAIPYLVSHGISPLDPATYRPLIPNMRAFMALMLFSIITYFILSQNDVNPVELADEVTADHRFYLVLEEHPFFRDHFRLLECDTQGIICRELFAQNGPRYNYDMLLTINDDTVTLSTAGRVLFSTQ